MQCPACNAENPNDAAKCAACGAAVSRRSKRIMRPQEVVSPFSRDIEPPNRGAAFSYRVACLGLVPGLGLIFGLVAALMGWGSLARHKKNPAFTAQALAKFAIWFGLLEAVTNWLGLYLMVVFWPWRG